MRAITMAEGACRKNMLDAFEFRNPDPIPVVYHPSPAGLFVHGQKLLDLFNQYPPDNPIVFDSIPSLPPGTLDERGRYHEVRRDVWCITRVGTGQTEKVAQDAMSRFGN